MEENTAKPIGKYIFYGGLGLVTLGGIIGGIYWFKKRKKSKSDSSKKSKISPGSFAASVGSRPSGGSSGFCKNRDYPLKMNTCHAAVFTLQDYLLKKHQANLGTSGKNKDGVDGKFGAKTLAAAKRYLKKTSFSKKDIEALKRKL